jgi:hypothetical protein
MGRQVSHFGQIGFKQIVNPLGKRFASSEVLHDRFVQRVRILRFLPSLIFSRHPTVTRQSSNATERTGFAGFVIHRLHSSLRLPIDVGVSLRFPGNSLAGSFHLRIDDRLPLLLPFCLFLRFFRLNIQQFVDRRREGLLVQLAFRVQESIQVLPVTLRFNVFGNGRIVYG